MKPLKAFLCVISVFAAALAVVPARSAQADSVQVRRYAYADLGSTVYFCREKSRDTALFAVPQTYCVEILEKENDWLRVRYAEDSGVYRAVYGYCLESELIPVEKPFENLYLHTTVTVKFKPENVGGVLPGLAEIEMTAAYYGAYDVAGTQYSYVLCGESFGYISGAITDYPLNTLPTAPTFSDNGGGGNTALVSAVAVSAIAVAAVAVLYFSSRKKQDGDTSETALTLYDAPRGR